MNKQSLLALGKHLQQLRLMHGISLSQLASNAGIAKSNLSRLEQGSGNPTIDTIWRIALELNVPFSTLVAPIGCNVSEDGVEVQLLEKGIDSPNVDAYKMSLAPNMLRQAAPHTSGAREVITMISGKLTVGPETNLQQLKAGETFSFSADQAHRYQTGEDWAIYLVTIVYETTSTHT